MSFLSVNYFYRPIDIKVNRIILDKERIFMWKKTIEWLDWNDARNTFPKWLWVMNGVVIGFAILVIIFVP
jgi:hypothetical protein